MDTPISEASTPSSLLVGDSSGSTDHETEPTNPPAAPITTLGRILKLRISAKGDIDEVWPDTVENVLPALKKNQTREITSMLLEPISITVNEEEERIRAHSNRLPSGFYRTYYETSQTACCFVNRDTHPKHREFPDLKITADNAFQSIGSFSLAHDLKRERIERQLIWNKKIKSSSYISAFDDIGKAGFHYDDSQRIVMRASVARIETNGLMAATVRAQMATTVKVTTVYPTTLLINDIHEATKIHNVTIPVWIRKNAFPQDRSAITSKQWESSGTDMWLSITEIRNSDMKLVLPKIRRWDTIAAKGHAYEWLACDFIPRSLITHVMPWDGFRLHLVPDARIVHSIDSPGPWVFDSKSRMWKYDPRLYRTACFLTTYGGNKRKLSDQELNNAIEPPKVKRRKTVRITKNNGIMVRTDVTPVAKRNNNPYHPDYTPDPTESAPAVSGCCSACGHRKTLFQLDEEIDGPLAYLDLAAPSTNRGH
ncbi:hypothetical protein A1F94_006398 [Pyrenophora tritici-repentis]|nr:hypothetical protein A1F94_006398 [Pyrenophora tritici-repentis]KAI1580211.1 hypothetical protein PtrEW13061_010060 [Pyrenophora tritici-repentis]PZC92823.1 hypothetical protein A1F95_07776 [Pyrenophora tritici-repentis]PZD26430.1 hypothetical protein A1F96_07600 [Pyrenophora tritici-repentis]PZD37538.1 hypothetical protein A1F97_07515 [Pyrenophora tritici-repentis]